MTNIKVTQKSVANIKMIEKTGCYKKRCYFKNVLTMT